MSYCLQLIYTPIFFGILGAEGVFVGSNPAYRFFELDELYKLVEPTLIITSTDLLPIILQVVIAGGKSPSSIYCADAATFELVGQSTFSGKAAETQSSTDQSLTSPFEELLSHGEHEPFRILDQETARATLAAFFTTSGTTGLPKAATFSHDALINLQRSYTPDVPYEVSGRPDTPLSDKTLKWLMIEQAGCEITVSAVLSSVWLPLQPRVSHPSWTAPDFLTSLQHRGMDQRHLQA